MNYDVDLSNSILGGTNAGGVYNQAALVAVKDEYNPYGLKVYCGCSNAHEEREVYQDVAGYGDEISFATLKHLVETMEENYKQWEKNRKELM